MGDLLDWAKREVELACKRENPERKEGEFDYGCNCYESALKAFKSLCEDEHSGFSIKMTQSILNRLINVQPLTPIEDTDDIWNKIGDDDGYTSYQCKRMCSLFKDVYADGTVKYSDNNYCYCVDINDPNCTYTWRTASQIIEEMFPITMPYMPGKPIVVYCEDFLTDKNHGDFDTVGILYAIKEEHGKQEKFDINRFYRGAEKGEDEEGYIVEISKEEYEERKARKIDRKKGEENE